MPTTPSSTLESPFPSTARRRPVGPVGIVELIGRTPLIDLSALTGRPEVKLYGKAEMANPGGSVKDRPALAMIEDAERRGLFAAGRRLLDSTSGNTGIAYAMIGAARGIPVTLCLPESASEERKRILKAYGVDMRITDPLQGSDGAILEARRLVAEEPERWAYLDQYSNPENWRAHYHTTGPEIWEQTDGAITHFVTGLGTSGTFMGVGRFLRDQSRDQSRDRAPAVRLISVEPDSPFHGLEGMKHMATAIVPPIYDAGLADEALELPTEKAYAMVKRLAREAGLLVGVSSGANVAAALGVAAALREGVVVTVLCDSADKYLSERFWEEP